MLQTILSNYISAFLLVFNVVIFGVIIIGNNKKINSIKKFILFQLICVLYALAFHKSEGTIKTLIMFVGNIIIYRYAFNLSLFKAIFLNFLYMIILIIPDGLILLFFVKIINQSDYYYNEFINTFTANLSVVLLFIIITYLFKNIIKKIINIKIEENKKLIIYFILTLACISIFFYKTFLYLKFDLNFVISIFIMITFLAILGSLIKQILDNNKLTKEYDNLLEFMTTYENEIEKQRIIRHETKNEFLTIRAKLCDNQNNKEIVNYIDELLKDKIKVKQEEYAKFGYLPANGIKGLCYFKVQEAENKGINVALNISKKVKQSPINKLSTKEQKEFGRILGVLLDNAIEASINSKDKKIGIEFYSKSEEDFKMIISNTFDNKIDKDKIGKEKFSTKGKNRGHGLLLLKQIISNNSIYELKTNITDNLYIQTITIKKV